MVSTHSIAQTEQAKVITSSASSEGQHFAKGKILINGNKTPELISDSRALRIWLLSLSDPDDTETERLSKVQMRVANAYLNPANTKTLYQVASGFSERRKSWTEDTSDGDKYQVFTAMENTLNDSLTPQGKTELTKFLSHIKQHTVISKNTEPAGCKATYIDAAPSMDEKGHFVMHAWNTSTTESESVGCPSLGDHFSMAVELTGPNGQSLSKALIVKVGARTATTEVECGPSCDPGGDDGEWDWEGCNAEDTFAYNGGVFFCDVNLDEGLVVGDWVTVALTQYSGIWTGRNIQYSTYNTCQHITACSTGTPSCVPLNGAIEFGPNEACAAFAQSRFLKVGFNGQTHCFIGVTTAATAPGPCS